MSDRTVAIAFLTELGAPITEPMITAVSIWRRAEGPLTGQNGTNNPFNIETSGTRAAQGNWYTFQQGWQQGSDSGSTVYFAKFATPEDGARAAALNLQRVKGVGYEAVITAAWRNDPIAFLTALGQSSWAGGHYALGGVKGGKLLAAFGAGPAPVPDSAGVVVPGTISATFSNLTPTLPLSQTIIDQLMGDVPVDNPNRAAILAGLVGKIGTPINQVKMPTDWNVTPTGGWQNYWGGQAGPSGSGGGLGNSGIAVDIGPLGTAVSIATYLAALFVIGLGVFLYSKRGVSSEAAY